MVKKKQGLFRVCEKPKTIVPHLLCKKILNEEIMQENFFF